MLAVVYLFMISSLAAVLRVEIDAYFKWVHFCGLFILLILNLSADQLVLPVYFGSFPFYIVTNIINK